MNELLLPRPSQIYRYDSENLTFWGVPLQIPIHHRVLIEMFPYATMLILSMILKAAEPDMSFLKLSIIFLVTYPFIDEIQFRFEPDLFVTANQDSLSVRKVNRWLTFDMKVLRLGSCVDVELVHRDGKRLIRVFTEADDDLVFGEMLAHEEKDCLFAEIKAKYFHRANGGLVTLA